MRIAAHAAEEELPWRSAQRCDQLQERRRVEVRVVSADPRRHVRARESGRPVGSRVVARPDPRPVVRLGEPDDQEPDRECDDNAKPGEGSSTRGREDGGMGHPPVCASSPSAYSVRAQSQRRQDLAVEPLDRVPRALGVGLAERVRHLGSRPGPDRRAARSASPPATRRSHSPTRAVRRTGHSRVPSREWTGARQPRAPARAVPTARRAAAAASSWHGNRRRAAQPA